MKKPMHSPRKQSGAVLYVALIMLILLALIGIVAMQIAGLQERMSANYQASNIAFQKAESTARVREAAIKTNFLAGDSPATNIPPLDCVTPFDPQTWDSTEPHVRRLDLCIGGDISQGGVINDSPTQIYQVTAFNQDGGATSEAIVDTVFIP